MYEGLRLLRKGQRTRGLNCAMVSALALCFWAFQLFVGTALFGLTQ